MQMNRLEQIKNNIVKTFVIVCFFMQTNFKHKSLMNK